MAFISTHDPLVLAFGILGNIVSFIVFLAPVPTFVRVYKKKSTEGYQSIPYLVTLFSAMLWIYYAMLKSNVFLLITINSFGCVIETLYLAIYIAYAPKQPRIFTLRTLVLLNLGGACLIFLVVQFLTKEPYRVHVLGWICVAFSVSVFAAPLSIMRLVIRTKSVEFMPFHLSFFLTLSAVMWLFYGIFLKDFCVMIPNVLGLVFGILQMGLYTIYKNYKPPMMEGVKLPEQIIDVSKLSDVTLKSFTSSDTPQVVYFGSDHMGHDVKKEAHDIKPELNRIESNETDPDHNKRKIIVWECVDQKVQPQHGTATVEV